MQVQSCDGDGDSKCNGSGIGIGNKNGVVNVMAMAMVMVIPYLSGMYVLGTLIFASFARGEVQPFNFVTFNQGN